MTASQRVSRGFHRLAVFLAAVPLLIGLGTTIIVTISRGQDDFARHENALCAFNAGFKANEPWKLPWDAFADASNPFADLIPLDKREVSLKKLGCSSSDYETVTFAEAREPGQFDWLKVAVPAALGLGITLGTSLVVYGLVRAIGWVIGGFAAS